MVTKYHFFITLNYFGRLKTSPDKSLSFVGIQTYIYPNFPFFSSNYTDGIIGEKMSKSVFVKKKEFCLCKVKTWSKILFQLILISKGHLFSKCLFGVFNFFHKMNKNKSTWGFIVVKLNWFICCLEETSSWKNHFDFF